MGVKITRNPGPITWPADETGHRENIAFIEDSDGYQIELVERPADWLSCYPRQTGDLLGVAVR